MNLSKFKNDEKPYSYHSNDMTIKYLLLDNKVYISDISSYKEDLVIPEYINEFPITGLLTSAIHNNNQICSITLPKNLKFIGSNAIYDCRKLHTLKILENVEFIGPQAVTYCKSLSNLYINCKHIENLPEAMIDDCGSLKNVYFYANADNIHENVFRYAHKDITIFCSPRNKVIEQLENSEYKIQLCYSSLLERFLEEDCSDKGIIR